VELFASKVQVLTASPIKYIGDWNMGTRLYVETSVENEVKIINSLVKGVTVTIKDVEFVNNGGYDTTKSSLMEVFKNAGMNEYDADQLAYEAIADKLPAMYCVYSYHMNGLGKIKEFVWERIEKEGKDQVSGTVEGELAKEFYRLQMGSEPQVEIRSVYWG
jgi:hypothetical protein